MRFKSYVWPHNPRACELEFRRIVRSHKVPFGAYALQDMGRTNRVLSGVGEFAGPGAYDEFKRLATVFYDNTPGILVHPVWQISRAYFVSLSLNQEPSENFVSYAFEFWECFDEYSAALTKLSSPSGGAAPANTTPTSEKKWYTVVSGDCLWNIAAKNGISLNALISLNPQIKNPNLIYAGHSIRIA